MEPYVDPETKAKRLREMTEEKAPEEVPGIVIQAGLNALCKTVYDHLQEQGVLHADDGDWYCDDDTTVEEVDRRFERAALAGLARILSKQGGTHRARAVSLARKYDFIILPE